MYAVIFEVEPRRERRDEYLQLAQFLKPELEKIDGFIGVERFAGKTWPSRMLSLSTWRDEEAVARWRSHAGHRRVQHKGRSEIFSGYRLRVGEIVDGAAVSGAVGGAFVSISEWTPASGAPGGGELAGPKSARESVTDVDLFESIYVPGKRLLLLSWSDGAAAAVTAVQPSAPAQDLRHRLVRVVRDYGLFDRREAPQFFPEIPRTAAE